ncbi:MAG: PH domain-containing protein [Candidatus Poribacteria bacterium]|nr:PH domain-containing protein [Candidatus Poribacteria bacterium]MDE0504677.1 PH domain-containing protein [Candidatus Poribacteria bacterium]
MSGYELEVYLYFNISSIEIGKNWLGHRIATFVSNNKMGMKWIKTGDVQNFIEYVKSRIEKRDQESTPLEPTVDIPDQIKKLA